MQAMQAMQAAQAAQTMQPDHVVRPDFAVAVRGYDRAQVDDYVGRVLEWLADAERRTVDAEETCRVLRGQTTDLRTALAALEERAGIPGPRSLHAFNERMGEVMQAAVTAAEELRLQAEREANERRETIAAEVQRTVERANAEAHEIVRRAHRKERAMEGAIAGLVAKRAAALGELGRLHHRLGELLALPEPEVLVGTPGAATAAGEPAASRTATVVPEPSRHVEAIGPGDVGEVMTAEAVSEVEAVPAEAAPALPMADTGEVLVTPDPTQVSPARDGASSRRSSRGSTRRA